MGWVVETLSVPHTTEALAYRLSRGSSSLVYSGDMEYDPRNSRVSPPPAIFCSSNARRTPTTPSARPPLGAPGARALSREARAGETLLTHLSDASAEAAERLIAGDPCVSLAKDLMRRKF